jgi:hypothetical protein
MHNHSDGGSVLRLRYATTHEQNRCHYDWMTDLDFMIMEPLVPGGPERRTSRIRYTPNLSYILNERYRLRIITMSIIIETFRPFTALYNTIVKRHYVLLYYRTISISTVAAGDAPVAI